MFGLMFVCRFAFLFTVCYSLFWVFSNPSFSEWSESPPLVLFYVEQVGVSLCTHLLARVRVA